MKTNEMFMDGDQALMTFGPLGVVVWRGECTLRAVGRVKDMGVAALAGAAAAGAPGVGVIIGVAEESCVLPAAVRERLSADA